MIKQKKYKKNDVVMKNLLINRKPLRNRAWGGGNLFVIAMCDYAKDFGWEVTHKLEDDLDAILMVDPRYDDLGISAQELVDCKLKNKIPLFHRINECDARKNTNDIDSLLIGCSYYTDCSIFVSKWMMNYFQTKGWHCRDELVPALPDNPIHKKVRPGIKIELEKIRKNYYIYNGVYPEIYYSGYGEEKIKNGKTNIVIAHWSNNLLKNVFTHKIDEFVGGHSDEYTFTYIGRPPQGLKNTKIIAPLYGKDLGNEIRKYDVCINSSKDDPASNSIMEAIASGIPTYAWCGGGGSLELVGEDHVYKDWEEIKKILLSKRFSANTQGYKPFHWYECVRRYFDVIDYIIKNKEINNKSEK